jgi:hypothetical protein
MANPARPGRDRESAKRGPGKRIVEGGSTRLADEVRYIQQRAANHDGRIVTIGQLVLFSTETGDAWLLDRTDLLAARLARNGEAEPIPIVETAATFAIEWERLCCEDPSVDNWCAVAQASHPVNFVQTVRRLSCRGSLPHQFEPATCRS